MMCKSCGGIIADATQTKCPKCGQQLQPADDAGRVINRTLARPRISAELDFATTVDRTGSSLAFQLGIPLAYEKIVRGIEQMVRDVKLYLFSHGDLECNEETILLTNGGNAEQAVADVKRIAYGGGGDAEETHLDAIEHAMNHVPWRNRPNKSRSALLAFLTDDSKPCRSGLTPKQLGEELKQRNILLYLICQPTPILSELVDAAGGLMFAISNSPDPKELEQIANQLTASIHAATSTSTTMPLATTNSGMR